jgi:hypothetical protein
MWVSRSHEEIELISHQPGELFTMGASSGRNSDNLSSKDLRRPEFSPSFNPEDYSDIGLTKLQDMHSTLDTTPNVPLPTRIPSCSNWCWEQFTSFGLGVVSREVSSVSGVPEDVGADGLDEFDEALNAFEADTGCKFVANVWRSSSHSWVGGRSLSELSIVLMLRRDVYNSRRSRVPKSMLTLSRHWWVQMPLDPGTSRRLYPVL